MSDSLRIDEFRAFAAASDADRDARTEQLLLTGLDHYFASQYDDAISAWTRVLFFDRRHARACAYIERARCALAERQRQSGELLQKGVAAFQRGGGGEARRLVQAAIDGGAPADEAFTVLDRLSHFGNSSAVDLAAGGRLRDALIALEPVRSTDPQKADADYLRGEIQLQLMGLTSVPAPSSAVDDDSNRGQREPDDRPRQ